MSGREAVIVLLFDLPSKTKEEKKQYIRFRSSIRSIGYFCLQESVYVKMLKNISSANHELNRLAKIAPKTGEVLFLLLNYSAFSKIKTICGAGFDLSLFASELISI